MIKKILFDFFDFILKNAEILMFNRQIYREEWYIWSNSFVGAQNIPRGVFETNIEATGFETRNSPTTLERIAFWAFFLLFVVFFLLTYPTKWHFWVPRVTQN